MLGAAGVIQRLSEGPGEPDALVELAERHQPGVAGELTWPRLDDERGARPRASADCRIFVRIFVPADN